ncbi:MAG TPA: XdhC/CoxI family protein [Rectinemataceae bacterium]|nr:XdhC/CoxI family protein [Rectinemataceae bacterium]
MSDDADIFAEAARLSRFGLRFALAGIVSSSGSTPRSKARMLMRGDGTTLGTIGGGIVESKVIADAAECLKSGESRTARYDLDTCSGKDSVGMLCGGSMEVFIDVVVGRPRLVIIGAGHVGLALAKLADFAGFGVAVVDERPSMVTGERFPMAEALYCDGDLVESLNKLPADPEALIVIATHSDDERALRAMIGRPWKYLGMLGSRGKVSLLMEKLGREGVEPTLLAKVRAPIGLDIDAETPEEIAISILSEIIADTRSSTCGHMSEKTYRRG